MRMRGLTLPCPLNVYVSTQQASKTQHCRHVLTAVTSNNAVQCQLWYLEQYLQPRHPKSGLIETMMHCQLLEPGSKHRTCATQRSLPPPSAVPAIYSHSNIPPNHYLAVLLHICTILQQPFPLNGHQHADDGTSDEGRLRHALIYEPRHRKV